MSKPDQTPLDLFKNIGVLIDQLRRAFVAHMNALELAIEKVEQAARIVEEGKK